MLYSRRRFIQRRAFVNIKWFKFVDWNHTRNTWFIFKWALKHESYWEIYQTLLLLIAYKINYQALHTQLSWLSTFKNFQKQKERSFDVFNHIKTTMNRYRYEFHSRSSQISRSKRHLHYHKSTHQETSLRIMCNWEREYFCRNMCSNFNSMNISNARIIIIHNFRSRLLIRNFDLTIFL